MVTIKELKDADEFKVVDTSAKPTAHYVFKWRKPKNPNEHPPILFVTGDVFGEDLFEIKDYDQLLFNLARSLTATVNCEKFSFELISPSVSFD